MISTPINPPEDILRSCLLRTESLPPGIFANTADRRPSYEGDETPRITNDSNDQFILRSKQAPQLTVIPNSEKETEFFSDDPHDRFASFSSEFSHITDDDDDYEDEEDIYPLSDDQINHLASTYHPYQSEIFSTTGMHDISFKQSYNIIPESLLY